MDEFAITAEEIQLLVDISSDFDNVESVDGNGQDTSSSLTLSDQSVSTLDENNSSSQLVKVAAKRKRAKRVLIDPKTNRPRIRHEYLPRIYKNDNRRDYGSMFVNVFNSCDYSYMMLFLQRYCCKDERFVVQKETTALDHNNHPPIMEMQGAEALAPYWFARMNDTPDLVFAYDQSSLKIRTDHTAVFTGRFQIKGTKLLTSQIEERFYHSMLHGDGCPMTLVKEKMALDANYFAADRQGYVARMIDYQIIGKMSLHLDEHSQIYSIEMFV